MEHIGIIVSADAEIGLGSRVITLFKGVDEYIDEGINQERSQEYKCRQ